MHKSIGASSQRPKINYKECFKFLFHYVKTYKFASLFVFISTFLSSALLAGTIIGQYYYMQFITKLLQDSSQSLNQTESTWYFVGLIFGYILQLVLFVSQTILMTKIAQMIGRSIRKDLFLKLLKLKLAYFDSNLSGDIMSKLTNDVNNITNSLTQNVTQLLTALFQMFWMLIAMLAFSPLLSLFVLLITPIQFIFIFLTTKKALPYFVSKQKVLGELNGFVEETISGQKVINNFDEVDDIIAKFDAKNEQIKDIDRKSTILSGINAPWILFTTAFILIFIIVVGIYMPSNIDLGGVVSSKGPSGSSNEILNNLALFNLLFAFTIMLRNFLNPLFQMFQLLNVIQAALAGTSRVFTIFEQKNEVSKNEDIIVKNLKGNVQIKKLSFSYDGKKNVLKNINLNVKAGEVVGIVGPTGSGKTTIINLLTKFYDIEEGDILIDNISVKNITKKSLRDEVSIVLQDTYIFEESVYQNIRYAKPSATDKEIETACIMANADNFIRSLKDGYNTILKNNADGLSQGEKQLLAIARAILKKSSILILDEATSSIDTKTEKDIREGMVFASKNKTTFIIAHRLSTIKSADKIVVLKDGEILEMGNHEQLLSNKGFYYNLYTSGINTPEDL